MGLAFFFLGVPLILYAGLAALPRGRAAWTGIAVVALGLGALWADRALSAFPFTGVPRADADMVAATGLWSVGAGLGALAQALRPAVAPLGRAAYPALALLIPVAALGLLVPRLAM